MIEMNVLPLVPVDTYGRGEGGSEAARGVGECTGEYVNEWLLPVYSESVSSSSSTIDGKSALTCQSGATSPRQVRTVCRSGLASRLSSQQRCRSLHSSSTSPSFAASSGLYGRTPCSIASLILSVSQPAYGTCPHSTY